MQANDVFLIRHDSARFTYDDADRAARCARQTAGGQAQVACRPEVSTAGCKAALPPRCSAFAEQSTAELLRPVGQPALEIEGVQVARCVGAKPF